MATMKRYWRIGVPISILAVLVAALALAYGPRPGGGSGFTEQQRIAGVIEYSVWDAFGTIKTHKVIHNTTLALLLNDARDRIGIDGTTITNTDLFDNIQLCSNNASGGSCTLTVNIGTNPADGTNTALGESGNYHTVNTFTATGAATIEEMQLTRGTTGSGENTNRGAWQDVSITLASGDTLQVTWTVDID